MIVREFPFPPILKLGFNKHCSFISCWNILLWPDLGKVYKFALQIWIQAFRLILYASFSSIWLCSHVGHPMSNHRSNYLVARICRMHRMIATLRAAILRIHSFSCLSLQFFIGWRPWRIFLYSMSIQFHQYSMVIVIFMVILITYCILRNGSMITFFASCYENHHGQFGAHLIRSLSWFRNSAFHSLLIGLYQSLFVVFYLSRYYSRSGEISFWFDCLYILIFYIL